jgi:hypothetical protein
MIEDAEKVDHGGVVRNKIKETGWLPCSAFRSCPYGWLC